MTVTLTKYSTGYKLDCESMLEAVTEYIRDDGGDYEIKRSLDNQCWEIWIKRHLNDSFTQFPALFSWKKNQDDATVELLTRYSYQVLKKDSDWGIG